MFKEILETESVVENTKGGLYYSTTFNKNLDLFTLATRYKRTDELISLFDKAYKENSEVAILNLLHILDIRGGKGERRVFNILFNHLCDVNEELAKKVLYLIPDLGRYDYILKTEGTKLWPLTIDIIKSQLEADMKVDHPSLLAKWLPSVRTHNVNNPLANKLAKELSITPKEYRKTLTALRNKINIVEHNLTNKDYESINYEEVPSVAMLRYHSAFLKHDEERFIEYNESLKNGTKKVNAGVLAPYQIIKQAIKRNPNKDLLNELWKNQTDVLEDNNQNVLVIADTSGSMWSDNELPISTALALAIYIAERNKGIFHNTFINFSDNPTFQYLKGESLSEKLAYIDIDNWGGTTNIDKALKMILNATLKSDKSECPSHLVIISDMEFDRSIDRKPNYKHWKDEYEKNGLTMPKVIFWCVSANQQGVPITRNVNNTCIISGFSQNVFKGILNIENYNPCDAMLEILERYKQYL